MNFFGLGPIEVLIILIVALLVVGPEKLPELGAMVGRFILDFRRVSDEVKGAFNEALVEPRPTWNGASAGGPASSQVYAPLSSTTPEPPEEAAEPAAPSPIGEEDPDSGPFMPVERSEDTAQPQ